MGITKIGLKTCDNHTLFSLAPVRCPYPKKTVNERDNTHISVQGVY